MLNTWIGNLFSMQRVSAVASITQSRLIASIWLISRNHSASDLTGSADVNAVHLGGLQDRFGADLRGPQRGGGVGGEERVAGTAGEDHDAALFEVADGAPADVRLGDLGT